MSIRDAGEIKEVEDMHPWGVVFHQLWSDNEDQRTHLRRRSRRRRDPAARTRQDPSVSRRPSRDLL